MPYSDFYVCPGSLQLHRPSRFNCHREPDLPGPWVRVSITFDGQQGNWGYWIPPADEGLPPRLETRADALRAWRAIGGEVPIPYRPHDESVADLFLSSGRPLRIAARPASVSLPREDGGGVRCRYLLRSSGALGK